ncbi:MAG: lipoprotein [Pseudomonadota bacterium]|nr:lipoprotein [Pseudomonadota bacterium]
MSSPLLHAQAQRRSILASVQRLAAVGMTVALLSACGQRGPLYIPDTPAAAQRATLPQTVLGGSSSQPAPPASAPLPATGLPEAPIE